MQLRPLGNHIIVEQENKETVTASGILLPDTGEKERPERGTVIAVGTGKMLENGTRQTMDVKVGERVVFKKYAPDEVKIDGKTFLVLTADDVMAVLE
jgi:chaperonin GroES